MILSTFTAAFFAVFAWFFADYIEEVKSGAGRTGNGRIEGRGARPEEEVQTGGQATGPSVDKNVLLLAF